MTCLLLHFYLECFILYIILCLLQLNYCDGLIMWNQIEFLLMEYLFERFFCSTYLVFSYFFRSKVPDGLLSHFSNDLQYSIYFKKP